MFNPKPTSVANFTLIRQDEDCLRADFKSEVWSPKNCIETDLNILLNTMKKGGTRGINNVMNGQRCKTFGLVSGSKRRLFEIVAFFQRIFQFKKKELLNLVGENFRLTGNRRKISLNSSTKTQVTSFKGEVGNMRYVLFSDLMRVISFFFVIRRRCTSVVDVENKRAGRDCTRPVFCEAL